MSEAEVQLDKSVQPDLRTTHATDSGQVGETNLRTTISATDELASLEALIFEWASSAGVEISSKIGVIGPIAVRPYSRLYKVEFGDGARPMAAKVCLDNRTPDVKFAIQQFGEMLRFHDKMSSDPTLRVVQPLAVFPPHGTILMQWIDGDPLIELLLRKSLDTRALLGCMRRAGNWLRCFHKAGPLRMCPPLEPDLRRDLAELTASVLRERITNPSIQSALNALTVSVPIVCGRDTARSWLHGDFQASNIMFSQGVVYGLDTAFSKEGIGLSDAAHLLNEIEKIARMPKGFHLLQKLPEMTSAFEEGYFAEVNDDIRYALDWFRTLDNLRFLVRHIGHTKSFAHRWYLTFIFGIALSRSVRTLNSKVPSHGIK